MQIPRHVIFSRIIVETPYHFVVAFAFSYDSPNLFKYALTFLHAVPNDPDFYSDFYLDFYSDFCSNGDDNSNNIMIGIIFLNCHLIQKIQSKST